MCHRRRTSHPPQHRGISSRRSLFILQPLTVGSRYAHTSRRPPSRGWLNHPSTSMCRAPNGRPALLRSLKPGHAGETTFQHTVPYVQIKALMPSLRSGLQTVSISPLHPRTMSPCVSTITTTGISRFPNHRRAVRHISAYRFRISGVKPGSHLAPRRLLNRHTSHRYSHATRPQTRHFYKKHHKIATE